MMLSSFSVRVASAVHLNFLYALWGKAFVGLVLKSNNSIIREAPKLVKQAPGGFTRPASLYAPARRVLGHGVQTQKNKAVAANLSVWMRRGFLLETV